MVQRSPKTRMRFYPLEFVCPSVRPPFADGFCALLMMTMMNMRGAAAAAAAGCTVRPEIVWVVLMLLLLLLFWNRGCGMQSQRATVQVAYEAGVAFCCLYSCPVLLPSLF